jgi:peptidoglycan/LPS O-acetylase OafA/YrhL
VEFQFYLVWPILVWRFRDRGLVAAMLAAACLSLLLRCGLSYSGFNYNTVSSLMFSRIDQFAFGGVAAALAYKGRSIRFAPWIAAGILLPFMAVLVMDPTWHKAARWVHTVGYSVLGVGTAALVLSAYQETLWRPFSQVLSSRPLVMIGDRSYSLYLWHLPFYPVISSSVRAGADGWGRTWVMVAVVCASSLVAFLFAEASYRLVEQRAATRRHNVT